MQSISTVFSGILMFATVFVNTSDAAAQLMTAQATSSIDSLRGSLIRLTWAEREVSEISTMLGGKVYLHERATEESFRKNAPGTTILHLATHAIINDTNPLYSKFVFAPDEDSTDDGFLNTFEIYNMQLDADLAVLSACNTGSGKLSRGEGIMSLARGFMYAGCPSIVTSLWPVDDQSTSIIMKQFYQKLSMGQSKDEALRAAKLEYLRNADEIKSNPFYWAGFVLIGNPDPIAIQPGRPRFAEASNLVLVCLACSAVIAFSIAFLRKLRYRKNA